jgi:hypothetical protein
MRTSRIARAAARRPKELLHGRRRGRLREGRAAEAH